MKKTTSVTSPDMGEVVESNKSYSRKQIQECSKKKDFKEFCEQSKDHYEIVSEAPEGPYVEVRCMLCKRSLVV